MRVLMPPRFRHSSSPSARFRHLLAVVWKGTAAAVDLEEEQRGRGAEQPAAHPEEREGSRAAGSASGERGRGAEQGTGERGEKPRSRGETTSGRGRAVEKDRVNERGALEGNR
jgi:hypothetical protein